MRKSFSYFSEFLIKFLFQPMLSGFCSAIFHAQEFVNEFSMFHKQNFNPIISPITELLCETERFGFVASHV